MENNNFDILPKILQRKCPHAYLETLSKIFKLGMNIFSFFPPVAMAICTIIYQIRLHHLLSNGFSILQILFAGLAIWSHLATKYTDPGKVKIISHLERSCKKCGAFKGPRTHHCSACNCCIEEMDHHCGWMGNCVAKNTLKFFMQFCFYVVLLCLTSIFGLVKVSDKVDSLIVNPIYLMFNIYTY